MLLTRAPLTLTRTSSRRGSFDLHVLGTPPAFVLSQDQTLMKVSWVVSDSYYLLACIFIELPLCLEFIFGYVVIIQMNYPLHIFGVCLCSVFNELRCCLLKQLLYNITFDWNCQQVFLLFLLLFQSFVLFAWNSLIVSCYPTLVNTFFTLILHFLQKLQTKPLKTMLSI